MKINKLINYSMKMKEWMKIDHLIIKWLNDWIKMNEWNNKWKLMKLNEWLIETQTQRTTDR